MKSNQAEILLLIVIPLISDSIKASIYYELVYINYAQKNGEKGNEYAMRSDPAFDPKANPYFYFGKYPSQYFKTKFDTTSVDLIDNYYIQGTVNDKKIVENIVVDTGASQKVISISFATKNKLRIDLTNAKGLASGLAFQTSVYSTYINKLKIGDVDFFNTPVLVMGDEIFQTLGLKGDVILRLSEMMMFDLVKFDYPIERFIMIKRCEKKDIQPNFALLDLKPILSYQIRNKTTSSILDTGSPYIYLYSDRWDATGEKKTKTVEKNIGGYKVHYYQISMSFSNNVNGNFEITIHLNRLKSRYKTESLLGIDIWHKYILTVDFKNRRIG